MNRDAFAGETSFPERRRESPPPEIVVADRSTPVPSQAKTKSSLVASSGLCFTSMSTSPGLSQTSRSPAAVFSPPDGAIAIQCPSHVQDALKKIHVSPAQCQSFAHPKAVRASSLTSGA